MEKRAYGGTGVNLSVVGFGGILVMDESPESARRIVAHALERGVNYFDVAPAYGNAEERLGPALKPDRDGVFLACKTGQRDAQGARSELENSLRQLQTDHFDLYQLHAVTSDEEVDRILGSGGALETFVQARERGEIRYLGFSAHSESAAIRLLDAFNFDSVLFPLNYAAWYEGDFGPRVIRKAQERGAAILALKALAKRQWGKDEAREWSKTWYRPVETAREAALGLRFTLSLPVTAAVSPGHVPLFDWACDAAENLGPLRDEEVKALRDASRGLDPVFSMR